MPATSNRIRRRRQQQWAARRRGETTETGTPAWRRPIAFFTRHSMRWRIGVSIGAVLVVLLLALALDTSRMYSSIKRADLHLAGTGNGSTNYLLVGTDTRRNIRTLADLQTFGSPFQSPGTHADQILILNVDPEGAVRLVAIPRDLLIDVPGKGEQRLTLTLDDGPQAFSDALCASLGLGVDHFVMVGFDGFRGIVRAIGGVDVVMPVGLRSGPLGLEVKAGPNHLDADQALALVRLRSGELLGLGGWIPLEQGAKTRAESGERVFRAIADKVAGVRSPFTLHAIADSVAGNLTVDSGLGLGDALKMRSALSGVGGTDLTMLAAETIDGETPVAYLQAGATETLQSIGAGSNPACPNLPRITDAQFNDTTD